MTTIYIDAGHGGTDFGTKGTYKGVTYYEKNINLQIAFEVKKILEMVKPAPLVYMSRTTDTFIDVCARGQDARNKGADVFVSIHNNSYSSTSTGTLTLYPKTFTAGYEASKQFASLMQNTVVNWLNKQNWNVKNNGISVWTNSTSELGVFRCGAPINSCLVELAFMSSPSDMEKLANQNFIKHSAYGIALGIVTWLNQNKGTNLSIPTLMLPTPSSDKTILGILFALAIIGGASYYYVFKKRRNK